MKKNVIIIILSILVLGLSGFIIYDKVIDKDTKEETSTKNDITNIEPSENNNTTEPESVVTTETHYGTFYLYKENEQVKIDNNLTIEFSGNESYSNMYEYVAKVLLNGKEVENSLFTNAVNRVIWSYDYTGSFRVEKIDNVYILISSIASQFNGNYVLIFNTEGTVLATYNDVSFMLDDAEKEFSVCKYTTHRIDEECSKDVYKISENSINKE